MTSGVGVWVGVGMSSEQALQVFDVFFIYLQVFHLDLFHKDTRPVPNNEPASFRGRILRFGRVRSEGRTHICLPSNQVGCV